MAKDKKPPRKSRHKHSFDPEKREELLKELKQRFPQASEQELLDELEHHGM